MKIKTYLPLIVSLLYLITTNACAQTLSAKQFFSLVDSAVTASQAKNWKSSTELWKRVVNENPVHTDYWTNYANALYMSKNYEAAIPVMMKKLELGAGIPANTAYDIACCYALVGKKPQALDWLSKAFSMGFTRLDLALKDEDLVSLRNEPLFKQVTFQEDVSKMPREKGWQYDLDFLRNEVKNKAFKSSRMIDLAGFEISIQEIYQNIPRLTDNEIIISIMKAIKFVGDGHSGMFLPIDRLDFKRTLPMLFYQFAEGTYITAADPKYKDLLGSEILEYGGNGMDKIYKTVDDFLQRDNIMSLPTRIPYVMRHPVLFQTLKMIPDADKVNLKLRKPGGQIETVTINADTTQPNIWNTQPHPAAWINYAQTLGSEIPLYLKNMNRKYWFEHLPQSKTLYMQINSVTNAKEESLENFVNRAFKFIDENNVEKLVLDIRHNNGGNTFLNMPLLKQIMKRDNINQRGKFFVIIGRRTFSAAQNLATMLERFTNAMFVGEPTGSSPNFVGEEDPLPMPYSKIVINISDLFWQTSWPTDKRTWIAPKLYIPPTFEAYKQNQDKALEAILNY